MTSRKMIPSSMPSSAEEPIARQAVIDAAHRVGAAAISWITVPSERLSQDYHNLANWQTLKLYGEMKFMARPMEDPNSLLGAMQPARTVISLIFPYAGGEPPAPRWQSDKQLTPGFGQVARYACGPDYHLVLPPKLKAFVDEVQGQHAARHAWRWFTDAVPLLERAWAREAELGFQGKNTLMIRPSTGSYFFIAEILTSAIIEGQGEHARPGKCGTCHACSSACPTAALETPHRLDARRCISYLTIEKRGVLDEWERRAIGTWLFGCDICQEVCPFNHHPAAGIDAFVESKIGQMMNLKEVLALGSDEAFQRRCGGTPLERTRRAGLVRNAICVAVNREDRTLNDDLMNLITNDPSPTVRATAVWGAAHLIDEKMERVRYEQLLNVAAMDREEVVRSECERIRKLPPYNH